MTDIDVPTTQPALWAAIHTERAALVADLGGLTAERWATRSLCEEWTVEETVAHLCACATVGRVRWLTRAVGARFDFALHNRRRLEEHLRPTPEETLAVLAGKVTSTVQPMRATPAWLGLLVIHGQRVRRPLGIATAPLSTWGETLPGSSLSALHAMLRRITSPGRHRTAW